MAAVGLPIFVRVADGDEHQIATLTGDAPNEGVGAAIAVFRAVADELERLLAHQQD